MVFCITTTVVRLQNARVCTVCDSVTSRVSVSTLYEVIGYRSIGRTLAAVALCTKHPITVA